MEDLTFEQAMQKLETISFISISLMPKDKNGVKKNKM